MEPVGGIARALARASGCLLVELDTTPEAMQQESVVYDLLEADTFHQLSTHPEHLRQTLGRSPAYRPATTRACSRWGRRYRSGGSWWSATSRAVGGRKTASRSCRFGQLLSGLWADAIIE